MAGNTGERGAYRTKGPQSTIKKLRVSQGMTQPEAAKCCNVSLRTFQRAEAGDAVPMPVKRYIERKMGLPW